MRTLLIFGPAALLCLLLSSCETKSDHPLAAPETAKIDPQLVGDWYSKEDDTTFHITVTDAHWLHVVITPKPVKPSDRPNMISNGPESYDFFVTDIGANHFLNVVDEQKENGELVKSYVFFRYTVSPNHLLHLWSLSQDACAAAVRAGKLKGTIHESRNGFVTGNPPQPDVDVTIQDSSENITSFIQSAGVNGLFNEKRSTLYPSEPPMTLMK
jgi:hypothetical protein